MYSYKHYKTRTRGQFVYCNLGKQKVMKNVYMYCTNRENQLTQNTGCSHLMQNYDYMYMYMVYTVHVQCTCTVCVYTHPIVSLIVNPIG